MPGAGDAGVRVVAVFASAEVSPAATPLGTGEDAFVPAFGKTDPPSARYRSRQAAAGQGVISPADGGRRVNFGEHTLVNSRRRICSGSGIGEDGWPLESPGKMLKAVRT